MVDALHEKVKKVSLYISRGCTEKGSRPRTTRDGKATKTWQWLCHSDHAWISWWTNEKWGEL